ncbi:MAG: SusC/RagA family TonB-linked outer membrane protein [Ginsengibacter sp.]
MKLVAILLLAGFIKVSAKGYSQLITVSGKNISLETVFEKIERQTQYVFFYDEDGLQRALPVTVDVKNASLAQVLHQCFKDQPLNFQIVGKTIVVNNIEPTQPEKLIAAAPVVLIEIKGKVKDENGNPLSGVSVSIIGENGGVSTDGQGNFSINVTEEAVLSFSHVGYKTITVPVKGKVSIEITLNSELSSLEDVVVTAFGIQRQSRTLTYATQKVDGDKLNEVKSGNIANSLSGKVAGMVVTSNAYGPGSSAKILLRGNRSIAGDNGALIVVDGAIIDNSSGYNRYGYNSNVSNSSDGISSINPDDVESINVLKGSAATALYGTTGANGVVLITTKKGKSGKLSVNVNSGVTYDSPLLSPEVQNEFGQGNGGVFGPNSPASWGPKITGQQVTDWTGHQTTLTAQPDNLKGFFRNALSLNNSIAFSGGTDITQTYFSYANVYSEGVVPENNLNRHTVNLRITSKVGTRFSTDVKATFVHQDIFDKPGVVGAGSAPMNIYKIPRTVRLGDVKNYQTVDSTGAIRPNYWYTSAMFGNPYWTVYNTHTNERRDRITGLISGKYQITEWLNVKAVVSLDLVNDKGSGESDANTVGAAGSNNGSFGYGLSRLVQRNVDLLVSGQNSLSGSIKVSYNIGGTVLDTRGDFTNISVRGLIVPNRFNLAFATQTQQFNSNAVTHVQRQAIFGTAQLSFKDYLYLDGTARQEYFSTLPSPYNSFYPSIGLSAILSDIFKMPSIVDYAKVRVGYAKTGGGGPGYLNKQTYTIYPNGIQRDVVSPFPDLKPELTTGLEGGTEWRFFGDRLNIDLTLYKSNTTNQLLRVPTPPATGFASQYINAGDIQNTGVEVVLNIAPLKRALTWNMSVNFAKNESKVISVLPGIDQVDLDVNFPDFMVPVVKVGGAFGDIYAYGWKRNTSGEYIVTDNGRPQRTDDRIKIGNYNPDFTLGINNSFTYKNFVFNFLVDGRFGGEMVSASDAVMAADGTPLYTSSHREADSWILPAVLENGSKNTIPINAETFWTTVSGGRNAWSEEFIYDATNVRLRELAIGYKFNKLRFLFIKDAKLSLVARNLFFFYRGYAKIDLPGIAKRKANFDSEINLYNSNLQGLEYGTLPPTRSIGLNLKLSL